jgi:hypothetical protein
VTSTRPAGSWSLSLLAVVLRPHLWLTGLRMLGRIGRPTREYLAFRMVTAYGDAAAAPVPEDAVAYLEWARSWHATIER